MALPYTPASRHAKGGYSVRATGYPVGAIRPNRLAAGMAYTGSRRGRVTDSPTTLTLSLRGTLDSLRGLGLAVERRPCPCCGGKAAGRLALTDAGRRRLRLLRQRRAREVAS